MKTFIGWTGLVVALFSLTGCVSLNSVPQGELSRDAEHPLIPVEESVYRIHNIKNPGSKVYLFATEEALADCFTQLTSDGPAKEACFSGIAGEVEDNTLVKALDCDSSEYAICVVQSLEEDEDLARGAILWDWLKPQASSKQGQEPSTPKAQEP